MLSVKNISYSLGARDVLTNVSFQISPGEKCTLIGRNGSGKTTLAKIIDGRLSPDSGIVELSKRYRMASIEQEMPSSENSLLDYVLSADVERTLLLDELKTQPDPEKISTALNRLEEIDAYSAPARAAKILNGLGFSENDQNKPVNTLSGGWRMRLGLARALFLAPDYLLLDEPTNHLDLESSLWLTGFLSRYPGAVLFTSHDRNLLNSLPSRTLELQEGRLTEYGGNFNAYCRAKAERQKNFQKEDAKQAAYRERLEIYINRFRAKGSTAKQVQSRIRILENMKEIDYPIEEDAPAFAFNAGASRISSPVIRLEGATLGYGDNAVLSDIDLSIGNADRIALVGHNGNGKSTLLKSIAGIIPLLSGERVCSSKIVIGYLDQAVIDSDATSLTAAGSIQMSHPDLSTKHLRSHLAKFGIIEKLYDTPVAQLSGGERARVAFAQLALRKPDILLLDEPTNHLDIQSRESLALAINEYEGPVIFVTHDAAFIEKCADQLVLVKDGHIQRVNMDVTAYAQSLNEVARQRKTANLRENKGLRP